MATMSEAKKLREALAQEWNKPSRNLEKCGELLEKLKLILTQIRFLPTGDSNAPNDELHFARDILETGALWSIEKKDIGSFERYMAQLKCYYFDYRKKELLTSPFEEELLGLNLLRLLAQNKISEFHKELELLPAKMLQDSVYINNPVCTEQYLMEGNYNKVFLNQNNVPSKSYSYFMNILLNTIRDEIADCMEKAYTSLALNEATRMLFFPSQRDMQEYYKQRKWTLVGDTFHFHREKKSDDVIPCTELAEKAIEYARELEMIV